MKTNIVVLCWLAVVAMLVAAGCATGKDREVKKMVTVGKPYIVRKFVIPKQKMVLPFLARKANSLENFTKEDLVPAMTVSEHLEVLAKIGRVPIRVREGFITKEKGQWLLFEWTLSGIEVVPYEYYVVDLRVRVCP